MLKNFVFVIVSFLFLLQGCGDKSNYVLLQSEKKTTRNELNASQSYEYIILPQDRLKIAIYKNPELTGETSSGSNQLGQDMQGTGVLVDTSGYISLPLINHIKVAGLTQTAAANLITQRYKRYLKIPTVYVEVLNKRVYVIGEVRKPGPVKLDREKVTLLEALAFAGDITDAAVRDNILILSKNNQNKPYIRSVDLTNFDHLSMTNMILRPNDIVYVQPNGWKEYKVASDNFTAPFKTIAEIASPFVQIKYLTD
ncbi:sugar transporter [Sulfurovum lithotrophicum]|nr:sugar transporter [Sulfurovum lithotrophicum]